MTVVKEISKKDKTSVLLLCCTVLLMLKQMCLGIYLEYKYFYITLDRSLYG